MNDQTKAAMQMALEALIAMDALFSHLSKDCTQYNAVDKCNKAITALREALAQPQGELVDLTTAEFAELAGCYQEQDYDGTRFMALPESSWEKFAALVAEATKAKYEKKFDEVFGELIEKIKGVMSADYIRNLREALASKTSETCSASAQPQGEPVAWMNTNGAVNNKLQTHQFILPTTTIADLETTLKLIKTINYLVGIAERGEGRKMLDNETPEKFVLGYVKKLESSTPPVVPQGEPVAWFEQAQNGNYPELKWKSGYIAHMGDKFYTTPPSIEAAIEATLEKAAKVCDDLAEADLNARSVFEVPSAADCAAAIRSMK